jgi:site-specific DNA recombinase
MEKVKVGIWIRVSTDEQAKGESPEHHEKRARMYAEIKNWEVAEVYNLSGTSGKSVIDHPETQKMLKDIASGRIQALIFSKLARLARNVRELLEISDHFQKYHANLVSLEESIDTSSPAGRLLFTVIGALAQWEREEISARVAASVPIRAKLGKPIGGIGPFGYKWVERRLVPNSEEYPTVRRAFELFVQNKKILSTCKALNNEGLRARKSKWRPTSLKRLLTDTVYIGNRRANYTRSSGDRKSWKLKPESEWVFTEIEPVVSTDIWVETNRILHNRPIKYSKGIPKESKYPFGGLLTCGCGTKMYVAPYNGMKVNRYVCRKCRNKINEDDILEHFLSGLNNMILKPEILDIQSDTEKEIATKRERLELIKKELGSVTNRINSVYDLYNDDKIDKKAFSERFNPLKERKEQIEQELPRLQAEIDVANVVGLNRDYVLQQAKTFVEMWTFLNDTEKHQLIKDLVQNIRIGQNELKISFFYLPEFMPLSKDDRMSNHASLSLFETVIT